MKKILIGLLMVFVVGCTKNEVTSVKIGSQTWTSKNLDVITYSDGKEIPQVTDSIKWANLKTGAWCYYENSSVNGTTYGKLYNWYAVAGIWNDASKTDETQRKKLAPTGYHIPSDAEWTILTDYLGGESIAGGKMKQTGLSHWKSLNLKATNYSGFTGLPGGNRSFDGKFNSIGSLGYWWSPSEFDTIDTWLRYLYNIHGKINRFNNYEKGSGLSVRCIKD